MLSIWFWRSVPFDCPPVNASRPMSVGWLIVAPLGILTFRGCRGPLGTASVAPARVVWRRGVYPLSDETRLPQTGVIYVANCASEVSYLVAGLLRKLGVKPFLGPPVAVARLVYKFFGPQTIWTQPERRL